MGVGGATPCCKPGAPGGGAGPPGTGHDGLEFCGLRSNNVSPMREGSVKDGSPLLHIDVFLDSLLHGYASEQIISELSNGILNFFVHIVHDRSGVRPRLW